MAVSRPVLRYFGGKFRLAPWIISHFPKHECYIEPFGGGANVLLRKARASVEIYNDLDQDVVNLFRALRTPQQSAELIRLLSLTPFSREEFEAAYLTTDEPVERARRLIVRSFMGHSSAGSRIDRTTGFRAVNMAANADPARSWVTFPAALAEAVERLAGVSIENLPAADLIAHRDRADVLFYVDPPYVHSTRSAKQTRNAPSHGYVHEMSDADHVALLDQLKAVAGMVVLSGYDSDLYDKALDGWTRIEKAALAEGARERVEVLWLNPAAAGRAQLQPDLLDGPA